MTGDLSREFPDTVIRASAGTGKTWQLTTRYLKLLRFGQPADQILASTFARKAAGEILSRVLQRLAQAASQETSREELEGALELGSLPASECAVLLRQVIGQIHRLRIGTLDSFFVTTAGSFALEFGLPAGWSILEDLDDRALRLEAVRTLLKQQQSDSFDALLTMLTMLQQGDSARGVLDHLLSTVDDFYGIFRETTEAVWHAWPKLTELQDEEVDGAIHRLRTAPLAADKRFATARDKLVQSAIDGDWDGCLANGLTGAVFSGTNTYYSKPLDDELVRSIEPLYEQARAVLLNRVKYQTESTWKLLKAYETIYESLKVARRGLRFEDITRMLAENLTAELLPQLAYRIDTRLRHLLLDEFQDTSLMQWNVLRPLAEEANRRSDESLFCVGDVKQAIYGWRGGESEILESVATDLEDIKLKSLADSRRSSPVIMEAVNAVFENISENDCLNPPEKDYGDPDFFATVKENWEDRFQRHTTHRTDLEGFFRVQTYPVNEENARDNTIKYDTAAEYVAELHRTHPGCTIGVLTRSNRMVGQLIYRLRNPRGDREPVFASEEGGNPLTDSAAVTYLLSALKLAGHPGDLIAQFNVAHSPLAKFLGLESFDGTGEAARGLARQIRKQILQDGYGKTLDGWVRELAPVCNERELSRLVQLVELAWSYESRATLDPTDFVRFVEETKVESPSSADVRVMTIHQSKGLEFDIVVLPELDGTIISGRDSYMVDRPRATEPAVRIARYLSKKYLPLMPPAMREMFRAHSNRTVNEALCLLYVAMTRAVHALHVLVAKRSKSNPHSLTAGGIVLNAVGESPLEPDVEQFRLGDEDWYLREREKPGRFALPVGAGEPPPVVEPIRLAKPSVRRRRNLNYVTPSSHGGDRVSYGDLLQVEQSLARARGSLIHAWFEQIEWLDGGAPPEEVLRRVAGRHLKPELDLDRELGLFRQTLEKAEVQANLTEAEYRDSVAPDLFPQLADDLSRGLIELEVYRERRITYRTDDELVNGIADRLVLFRRGGEVVAADVIDYKTDTVGSSSDVERLRELYRGQLAHYVAAMQRLYRLEGEAVVARLGLLSGGEFVRA